MPTTIIWEKPFSEKICTGDIPVIGRQCIGASGAIRLILRDGKYLVVAEVNGQAREYALANECKEVYSVGAASLQLCLTNVQMDGDRLVSVRVQAKLCIGALLGPYEIGVAPFKIKVGPFNLQQCWDIVGQDIHPTAIPDLALMAADGQQLPGQIANLLKSGQRYVVVEVPISAA